jgi:hypothetical protein
MINHREMLLLTALLLVLLASFTEAAPTAAIRKQKTVQDLDGSVFDQPVPKSPLIKVPRVLEVIADDGGSRRLTPSRSVDGVNINKLLITRRRRPKMSREWRTALSPAAVTATSGEVQKKAVKVDQEIKVASHSSSSSVTSTSTIDNSSVDTQKPVGGTLASAELGGQEVDGSSERILGAILGAITSTQTQTSNNNNTNNNTSNNTSNNNNNNTNTNGRKKKK